MQRSFNSRIRLVAAVAVIFLGGLVEARAPRAYCQSEFRKYFQGLDAAGTHVNPVERFIFSVLLTETSPARRAARPPQAQ
jgi:hypothetical protein